MKDQEYQTSKERLEAPTKVDAMIRMRCPECKKGIIYSHGSSMNRLCPNCGIRFDREPGYFSGAIWISTLLAMLFMMFCLLWFFRDLHPAVAGLVASLGFIPLVPITIRFSRSIWMYLDHRMHPQRPGREPPGDSSPSQQPPPPDYPGAEKVIPVEWEEPQERGLTEMQTEEQTQNMAEV